MWRGLRKHVFRERVHIFRGTLPVAFEPRLVLAWPHLTLRAADFPECFHHQPSANDIYKGTPIGSLSERTRGVVLASAARLILSDLYPRDEICDAVAGLCANGTRRSQMNAGYDWLRNGRRVECKTSLLQWLQTERLWRAKFYNVKLALDGASCEAAFDELLVCVCSPTHLYIHTHDLEMGVSTTGIKTSSVGCNIQLSGPCGETNWRVALSKILRKFEINKNPCKRLAEVPLHDHRILAALMIHVVPETEREYSGVPWACLSSSARGLRIEMLVRQVDILRYGECVVDRPDIRTRCNGSWLSPGQAEYDWKLSGRRIECKSSKFIYSRSSSFWSLSFHRIRFERNDELRLACYTPAGIYVYGYVSELDSHHGAPAHGKQRSFSGPRNQTDWAVAFEAVRDKLSGKGCELIAVILW